MGKKTILVVDDDPEVLGYLKRVFDTDGWKVLTETDGQWAIKTFESRRVDAAIVDILLPGLGGFQVVERIRSRPRGRDLPILLLSGIYRGDAKRAEAVEQYGLLGYLNKPVEGERIRRILRKHFGEDYPTAPAASTGRPPRGRRLKSSMLADGAAKLEKKEVESQARALSLEKVSLKGNLKTTAFPRLLHELYRLQNTGALFLLRDKVKKIVYLRNGRPVHIKSNLLRECLGQILIRDKIITRKQCEESLKRMKKSGNLQGQELVEMGLLSPSDLKLALTRQLAAKLMQIFAWPEGEYQFKESARIPAEDIVLDSSSATLIWQGIRKAMDVDQLKNALSSMMSGYVAPAENPQLRFQRLTVKKDARSFLELVDGTRTVRELLSSTHLPEERCLPIAYALVCSGMVELWDRPVTLPPLYDGAAAPAGTGAPDTLESEKAAELLSEELAAAPHMNFYQMLSVDPSADPFEVEQAFAHRARHYHPDGFINHGRACQDLAESIFLQYMQAYRTLRDPQKRQAYDEELAQSGPGRKSRVGTQVSDPTLTSVAAARYMEEGIERLDLGRYDEAAWNFRKAVELEPDEGRYRAFLGWAVYKSGPTERSSVREALQCFERAVSLSPDSETGYLYFGHLLSERGELKRAERAYRKALKCNPDCTEAAEALRDLAEDE